MTPAKAASLVESSPDQEVGADAKWVNIDSRWGLKYFDYPQIRDNTYLVQSLAHKHGLAPALGNKVNFCPGSYEYYGYVCERIVETWRLVKAGLEACNPALTYPAFKNVSKIIESHCKMMRDLYNINVNDMHHDNFGFDANGNIVIIDFSSSCGPNVAAYEKSSLEQDLLSAGVVLT